MWSVLHRTVANTACWLAMCWSRACRNSAAPAHECPQAACRWSKASSIGCSAIISVTMADTGIVVLFAHSEHMPAVLKLAAMQTVVFVHESFLSDAAAGVCHRFVGLCRRLLGNMACHYAAIVLRSWLMHATKYFWQLSDMPFRTSAVLLLRWSCAIWDSRMCIVNALYQ